VEQMTVSIDHIVARAVNTEQISMETSTLCDDGERVIDNASREITQIAHTVSELSTAIEALGQRSSEVGGIVQVIREIADQTNLLALNAAIEAARAGESGRGFAVVADEVRKLAERTGQATIQITKMIGSIRHEIDHAVENMNAGKAQVEQGVSTVDQASDSLVTIKSGSHKIEDMIREISAATHQQSGASAEIARNIETVANMARQNNNVINDVAAAAANLEQMSSNLQNMANRFKV
jgi:methyl-accepting chemotaxis protein